MVFVWPIFPGATKKKHFVKTPIAFMLWWCHFRLVHFRGKFRRHRTLQASALLPPTNRPLKSSLLQSTLAGHSPSSSSSADGTRYGSFPMPQRQARLLMLRNGFFLYLSAAAQQCTKSGRYGISHWRNLKVLCNPYDRHIHYWKRAVLVFNDEEQYVA